MVEVEVLVDKLNGFQSEQEIAEFFHHQGIRGVTGAANHCVISNWLKQESGQEYISTAHAVSVWAKPNDTDRIGFHKLSHIVKMFIEHFDNGQYPELTKMCLCDVCYNSDTACFNENSV